MSSPSIYYCFPSSLSVNCQSLLLAITANITEVGDHSLVSEYEKSHCWWMARATQEQFCRTWLHFASNHLFSLSFTKQYHKENPWISHAKSINWILLSYSLTKFSFGFTRTRKSLLKKERKTISITTRICKHTIRRAWCE